jgi:predicted ABC-type ATPase
MPNLFVLAGPNGAGKSTSAPRVLSGVRRVHEFVNADVIAKEDGLSDIEAGRRTLERLAALARERRDVAFETTLASKGLLPRIRAMRATGYLFHLTFFWLPSADMAVQRVARRVAAGGHSIPEVVIRRRYERGLEHFFNDYLSAADSWQLVDNTEQQGHLIASRDVGGNVRVRDNRRWSLLMTRYVKPRVEQEQVAKAVAVPWTSDDVMDAINVAVTEALRRHKERGESIVIWRDGKVVTLPPEEIDV